MGFPLLSACIFSRSHLMLNISVYKYTVLVWVLLYTQPNRCMCWLCECVYVCVTFCLNVPLDCLFGLPLWLYFKNILSIFVTETKKKLKLEKSNKNKIKCVLLLSTNTYYCLLVLLLHYGCLLSASSSSSPTSLYSANMVCTKRHKKVFVLVWFSHFLLLFNFVVLLLHIPFCFPDNMMSISSPFLNFFLFIVFVVVADFDYIASWLLFLYFY